MTSPPTPELDKQAALIRSGVTSTVQDFIDWLGEHGYGILRRCKDPAHSGRYWRGCDVCAGVGWTGPVGDFNALMADYFDIDLKVIEEERRALLAHIREANDG